MADPIPVIRGTNVRVTTFVGNVPQPESDLFKSIKVTEAATLHRDHYLGRKRARVDKTLDGHDISLEGDVAKTTLYNSLLAQQAARDANLPVPEIALLTIFTSTDGTQASYIGRKIVAKADLNVNNRADPVALSLDMQAENWDPSIS